MEPSRTAVDRPVLPRGTVLVLTFTSVLLGALALRSFADTLAPVLLALIFAISAAPLRTVFTRRGLPEWFGTAASVVLVYLIVLGFAWAALATALRFSALLGEYSAELHAKIMELGDWMARIGLDEDESRSILARIDVGKLVDFAAGVLGGLTGVLTSFFFIVILLFFLVTDSAGFVRKLSTLSNRGRTMAEALTIFADGTRSYLRVSTLFGAAVALVDVGALYLLDIRDPWLWGLLAFLTNYIPNIGFIIGLVPPAVVGLLDHGLGTAVAVVVVYSVVNFLLQTVVQPRVVGEAVGLSASISFLSLLVWTAIFGGIGALIAVPMTILVRAIFIDTDPERTWLGPLLSGGNDAPETPS
ncbi:AI-2E family transporter [Aeromicrobium tamlense]|uniref:AI-2E family transporter n=2 Tax=Aeromicrobium tamlense TaxID=375541 RepID=A0A8I0KJG0_9ACTN|nr:AI-2E family transporter [Aeromicrobium tamlense]MBD1270736.1 AI-2E family transporter [Aeromicrobium tamlense]MBD1271132.1 AI-2E family transporter [Aeromicrobium tamlense]NYI38128.1 putative PurR-regulated permease PerM [Aeromicrobium tamlense]